MIQYNLKCECGKIFDSWFSSSSEFDLLGKKKLLKCIYCNSSAVSKSVMAPNLTNKSNNNKSNKVSKKTKLEKDITTQLMHIRKYIEKNCENVGKNFSREARNIHYDKKSSKGIYTSISSIMIVVDFGGFSISVPIEISTTFTNLFR